MSCEEQLSAMESVNIDFASVQNFWFIPSQVLVSLLDCLVLPFSNVFLYFLKSESKKLQVLWRMLKVLTKNILRVVCSPEMSF